MIKVNVHGVSIEIAGKQPTCPWCGNMIDDIKVSGSRICFECLEMDCACGEIWFLSSDLNDAIQSFSTRKEPSNGPD